MAFVIILISETFNVHGFCLFVADIQDFSQGKKMHGLKQLIARYLVLIVNDTTKYGIIFKTVVCF